MSDIIKQAKEVEACIDASVSGKTINNYVYEKAGKVQESDGDHDGLSDDFSVMPS